MKINPKTHAPTPGWELLGNLELPVGTAATETICSWLTNILAPFNLSKDFFARVLHSVLESAAREFPRQDSPLYDHIHLTIFTPYEQTASQKTWGFFHTERTEGQTGSDISPIHRINFYLYVEGE